MVIMSQNAIGCFINRLNWLFSAGKVFKVSCSSEIKLRLNVPCSKGWHLRTGSVLIFITKFISVARTTSRQNGSFQFTLCTLRGHHTHTHIYFLNIIFAILTYYILRQNHRENISKRVQYKNHQDING